MAHRETSTEAADRIRAQIGDIEGVEVLHNLVMVGIYRQPETTKGGIILTDKTRKEDIWQGKAGIVLKMGALAFNNKNNEDFNNQGIKVGDWVAYRTSDGFDMNLNGKSKDEANVRLLEDNDIKLKLAHPEDIW